MGFTTCRTFYNLIKSFRCTRILNKIIIDYRQLTEDALNGLIEAFICREGTDYGEVEYSLKEKTDQVKRQLIAKEALILYDEKLDSTTIVPVT